MRFDFIKGSSSLLFIISTLKIFYSSDFFNCKISNAFLVVASYLYNASGMDEFFLLYDYFAIFWVSTSCINQISIVGPLFLSLLGEYNYRKSIEYTKNAAFLIAILKSNIYTYYYLEPIYFWVLLQSTFFSCILYKLRNYFYVDLNNPKYNLFLTYLFHLCITVILYISSLTCIDESRLNSIRKNK
jgi:hypothetical protein